MLELSEEEIRIAIEKNLSTNEFALRRVISERDCLLKRDPGDFVSLNAIDTLINSLEAAIARDQEKLSDPKKR
jgi:hypothetical protein